MGGCLADLEELEEEPWTEELCLPGDLGAISAETGDQLSGMGVRGAERGDFGWGVRFLGTQVEGG